MKKIHNISKLPKWAQSYIEQLENDAIYWENQYKVVRVLLDGSEKIKPDVKPPESFSDILSVGYWPYRGGNYNFPRVEPACSSSVGHSVGRTDRTTTQQPRWLYSTKSLAARSLLYEVEQSYLNEMGEILKKIEEFQKEENND